MENQQERSEKIREFLDKILELFDIQGDIEIAEGPEAISANITGEDLSILIGSRGRTLNAIQQIVNIMANKDREDWLRVTVDAEGYRERRKQTLEDYANRSADQVVAEGIEIELEPMNSFERRIVHCALIERKDVQTMSRGEDPARYIVILPAEEEAHSG